MENLHTAINIQKMHKDIKYVILLVKHCIRVLIQILSHNFLAASLLVYIWLVIINQLK